ncbi:leucine rich repeat containing protein BspA family protein, partial [Entamoeba invadens IP1]
MSQLDISTLKIVMQYLEAPEDILCVVLISKKCKTLLDAISINPIEISDKSRLLFQHLKTQRLFSEHSHKLTGVDHYLYEYPISYSCYLNEKTKGNICPYVCYNKDDFSKNTFKDSIGTFNIPQGVVLIGQFCFLNTKFTRIEIPDSVKEIGCSAFWRCDIKKLCIPDSVTCIESNAFAACKKLEQATLPKYLTKLPSRLFEGCSLLTKIQFPNQFSTGEKCFEGCGIVNFTVNMNRDVGRAALSLSLLTRIDFCEVKYVEEKLCEKAEHLQIVQMKDVLGIKRDAFKECKSLKNVIYSDNLSFIGECAFWGCSSLEKSELPKTVVYIGNSAFDQCINIQTLVFPKTVKFEGNSHFENCTSLKKLEIPIENLHENGLSISENEKNILMKLKKMKGQINGVLITEGYFDLNKLEVMDDNMTKLMFKNVSGKNYEISYLPSTLVRLDVTKQSTEFFMSELRIPENLFLESRTCSLVNSVETPILPKCQTVLCKNFVVNAFCENLKIFVVPETVLKVEQDAFNCCYFLTEIKFRCKDTKMEQNFYNECDSLQKITFSDGTNQLKDEITCVNSKEISPNRLNSSHAVRNFEITGERIVIPKTVTVFNFECLNDNTKLKELQILSDKIVCDESYPLDSNSVTKICSSKEIINDIPVSYGFFIRMKTLGNYDFKNVIFTYNDKKKYGDMYIKRYLKSPIQIFDIYKESKSDSKNKGNILLNRIHSVKFTKFANFMNNTYSNNNFDYIDLSCVDCIPSKFFEGVFGNCYFVTKITLSDKLQVIENFCFENCFSLKHINIPMSVTKIGNKAFKNCYNLEDNNLQSINNKCMILNYSFENCHTLKQINLNFTVNLAHF